ncbi:MAG: MOSC N-terminal beta barrel domain-containing protein [Phormidesmis sp.]
MAELFLSELYIYPVKSAAGIAVQQAQLTARGLQYDRRWMVVDSKGKFMTQRRFPRMALIGVSVDDEARCLRLSAPGMPKLSVRVDFSMGLDLGVRDEPFNRVDVEVWGDRTTAIAVGPESQQWVTQFIGAECQLVYMPDSCNRPTAHGQLGHDNLVSFADGYPYLLISETSLAGLNQRLIAQAKEPVTMQRFRPNFVIAGVSTPHEEDTWQQVQIGAAVFDLPKLCDRCSIPNVNPQTGDRSKEPTKTLSTYRYWDKGIWFGQNCAQPSNHQLTQSITLRVGDPVKVIAPNTPS